MFVYNIFVYNINILKGKNMAKKKKNSNYITEKTVARQEQALRDRRNAKIKKYSFITFLTVLIAALVITGLVFIILGINKHYDEEKYNTYRDAVNSRYDTVKDSISKQEEKFEVTHKVTLKVKDYGEITLDLYGKEAPYAVANFVKLVETGFYNGKEFSNGALDSFLIVDGSPSTGLTAIPSEITDNGIKHIRGTISMNYSSSGKVSATNFFFTLGDKTSYDSQKQYTAFGMVTSGMSAIDKMAADLGFTYTYNGNSSLTWAEEDRPEPPVIEKATVTESNVELTPPEVTHIVDINIEGFDPIEIELYGQVAPKTVEQFVKLINKEYYNGKLFNSALVEDGFLSFTQADSDYKDGTINGEFYANGYDNFLKLEQGSLIFNHGGSANKGSYKFMIFTLDENDSKFNSTVQKYEGYYSIFGKVTEKGLEAIQKGLEKFEADYDQYKDDKAQYDKDLAEYEASTDKTNLTKPTKPTEPKIKIETIVIKETIAKNFKPIEATHKAEIEIDGYGTIKLDLYGNHAPITVEHFIKLVNEGFYTNKTFHRGAIDFALQGGCPNGDGTGDYKDADGKKVTINGEFYANGYYNPIKHVEGTISMARGTDYNSASCQFFIVPKTSEGNSVSLDDKYAAFGKVTEGMDIIAQIFADLKADNVISEKDDKIEDDKQPVIKSITVTAVSK